MSYASIEDRRITALSRTIRVAAQLEAKGVKLKVIGSLAKGGFDHHSDVDLLVMECPRELKYAIEAGVEDILLDIPFDVVYFDEIPSHRIARFLEGAVDAGDLR